MEDPPQDFVLPPARSGHIAVCSGNVIIVWGGYNEREHGPHYVDERYLASDEVWIYHTRVERWLCQKTTGDTPPPTSGAIGVLIEYSMYVYGGHTEIGNTSETYRLDLQTWCWQRITIAEPGNSKPSPRDVMVGWGYQNKLYIFGGFGPPLNSYLHNNGEFVLDVGPWNNRGWNNQLVVLDIATQTWLNPSTAGKPPSPRAAHAAVRLGSKVYLFGGRHGATRLNDIHCLDLDQLKWSGRIEVEGELPCGRSWHSLSAVTNSLFLYGGYSQNNKPLSDAWIFDLNMLRWSQFPVDEDRPRLWHTGCCSSDEDLIIFGGCATDILSLDHMSLHMNTSLVFRFSPRSLLRLSLDAVYEYRKALQQEWQSLPRPLLGLLTLKLKGFSSNSTSEKTVSSKQCSIS